MASTTQVGEHKPVRAFAWTPKAWGWTKIVAVTGRTADAIAFARSGGYSSDHYHANKHNSFYIIEGCLLIVTRTDGRERERVVRAGEGVCVDAGVVHRFEAMEDTLFEEHYLATYDKALDLNDIVRLSEGGIK